MKTIRVIFITWSLFLVLFFVANTSHSYSVTPPTLSPVETMRNLIDRSSLIVSGTVMDISTRYSSRPMGMVKTPHRLILTDVKVRPISFFKGKVEDSLVTVTILGGCIKKDDICFSTDIATTFERREKVLLFLKENPEGEWVLSDFLYGKQPYSDNALAPLGLDIVTFQGLLSQPEIIENGTDSEPTNSTGGCSLLR